MPGCITREIGVKRNDLPGLGRGRPAGQCLELGYFLTMHSVVPLFPLPNFFLFPHSVVPLHIFEPRYRQMIDDQLDGQGRLVMGTLLEAGDTDDPPPVFGIGGLGEIVQHRKLPDGRYMIMLLGLSRVAITEVPSDRLYREVQVEVLEEIEVSGVDASRLRDPLLAAIHKRSGEEGELPDDLDVARLADILVQLLPLPQADRQTLFAELDAAVRAERALAEHEARG